MELSGKYRRGQSPLRPWHPTWFVEAEIKLLMTRSASSLGTSRCGAGRLWQKSFEARGLAKQALQMLTLLVAVCRNSRHTSYLSTWTRQGYCYMTAAYQIGCLLGTLETMHLTITLHTIIYSIIIIIFNLSQYSFQHCVR